MSRNFEDIVTDFVEDGDSDLRIACLADTFEVSKTTVRGWADGRYRPHPRQQKQIIAFIEDWQE